MPRLKPPFPAIAGLYAKPTVVNNVETLSTVPHIVTMGGAAYAEIGVNKSTGTRVVAISGHVKKPGNYEIEFGCTFRDVIYGFAGGIRDGHELKFFLPGGASFQWLVDRDEHLDAHLRHRLRAAEPRHDARLGRGDGVRRDRPIRCSSRGGSRSSTRTSRAASARRAVRARAGSRRCSTACRTASAGPRTSTCSSASASGISPNVATAPFTQTTLCPLGPSVVSPIASLDKYFRDEIAERLARERGSARVTTTEPKPEVDRRTPSPSPSTARRSRRRRASC